MLINEWRNVITMGWLSLLKNNESQTGAWALLSFEWLRRMFAWLFENILQQNILHFTGSAARLYVDWVIESHIITQSTCVMPIDWQILKRKCERKKFMEKQKGKKEKKGNRF